RRRGFGAEGLLDPAGDGDGVAAVGPAQAPPERVLALAQHRAYPRLGLGAGPRRPEGAEEALDEVARPHRLEEVKPEAVGGVEDAPQRSGKEQHDDEEEAERVLTEAQVRRPPGPGQEALDH